MKLSGKVVMVGVVALATTAIAATSGPIEAKTHLVVADSGAVPIVTRVYHQASRYYITIQRTGGYTFKNSYNAQQVRCLFASPSINTEWIFEAYTKHGVGGESGTFVFFTTTNVNGSVTITIDDPMGGEKEISIGPFDVLHSVHDPCGDVLHLDEALPWNGVAPSFSGGQPVMRRVYRTNVDYMVTLESVGVNPYQFSDAYTAGMVKCTFSANGVDTDWPLSSYARHSNLKASFGFHAANNVAGTITITIDDPAGGDKEVIVGPYTVLHSGFDPCPAPLNTMPFIEDIKLP